MGVVPWQIVTEAFRKEQLSDHVAALARLKEEGHEVLLITSGAVAAGFSALGYPSRPVTIKRETGCCRCRAKFINAGIHGGIP